MKNIFGGIIVLTVFSIDQFSKYFIFSHITTPLKVLGNFILINPTKNTGVAFGLFSGWGFYLLPLTFWGIILIFIYLKKFQNIYLKFSLFVILGGAIANIFDRIILGYVRDFIDFRFWPVFNFADVSIVSGTSLLLYKVFFQKNKITSLKD